MKPCDFCTCWPGVTVWLTGLPSAGKSSIARAAADRLRSNGRRVEILDGDENRKLFSADLGFSRADRFTNVQRMGMISYTLAANGILALVPVIAPYADSREAVRKRHETGAVSFVEVHIATPVDVCAQRDVKGLYARRRAGQISGLTGVDDPYEAPDTPELRIHAHLQSVEESTEALLTGLAELGLA